MAFASRPLRRLTQQRSILSRGGVQAPLSSVSASAGTSAPAFIDSVNVAYESLHRHFEEQFWGTKMALSSGAYSTAALTSTKAELETFLASKERLATTRALLAEGNLTEKEKTTLQIFERTFGCYIMGEEAFS